VGLGKTIEAGLICAEYLARGMVSSLLILTPASLVSQWQQELTDGSLIFFSVP
jgi:SNF2 family DNA or RNA helicase